MIYEWEHNLSDGHHSRTCMGTENDNDKDRMNADLKLADNAAEIADLKKMLAEAGIQT
ncbi:MAG: hypothetical protein K2K74_12570 [Lachnospiraceae bacterium]|nr:hypothetical protein [Lachnospiraceae bacterium]